MSVNHLNISRVENSLATRLLNSKGHRKNRIALNSECDNKTKIYVKKNFTHLFLMIDKLLSVVGFKRKWVPINVELETGGRKRLLINIQSLCKRTLLTKEEVSNLKPDELVQVLSDKKNFENRTKNLNHYFPNAMLINLDDRTDRIEGIEAHLKSIGQDEFTYERQSAVLGKKLPPEIIDKMSKSHSAIRKGKDDRHGRIGVFYSHLNSLKKARDNNIPNVLILEDDVRFMTPFFSETYLDKALNELPNNWGMLFLGYYEANPELKRNYSERLIKPGTPYDLHAYVVNQTFYDTLISALEKELEKDNGEMRAIDVVIGEDLVKTGKLYATKENYAIQDEGFSSIVNETVAGNYTKELKKLKKTFKADKIQEKKTADGFPVIPPLVAGTLYQMMAITDLLFEKHNIRYWTDSGTTLGSIRNKGLIPHDDDIDLQIHPDDEDKLNTDAFKQDLKKYKLDIVKNDVVGLKIFPLKKHPFGRWHQRDGGKFQAPCIDIFTSKEHLVDGKKAYIYKKKNAQELWPPEKYYVFHDEIFDENGEIHRVDFGPLLVNGFKKDIGKGICTRIYGPYWKNEIYLQYDHIREKGLNNKPVRLTDFRSPAYKEWDGLCAINEVY